MKGIVIVSVVPNQWDNHTLRVLKRILGP